MIKIKDKDNWIKSLPNKGGLMGILFFLFFNYCEAQNTPQVLMETSVNKKLSGLYSSKTPSDPISTRRGGSTHLFPSNFPVNNQSYKEEIDKRTYTSRTFNNNKGEVVIQYSSQHLNYLNKENKFQPIDIKLSKSHKPSSHEMGNSNGPSYSWASLQQQYPTYLYKDGSTALSADEKNKIIFNRNCKINDHEINYSDYTVGEQGMLINNVIAGVDKKIIFDENTIETDYIIREPINTNNQDVIISEEIELPEGYYTSSLSSLSNWRWAGGEAEMGLRGEALVVYSREGIEKARFNAPVFYDANKIVVFGKYNLVQHQHKTVLEIIIPEQWINDPIRKYPVTIDPVVTGPISNYPATYMNSCEFPNFQKDSILVTIPANITITQFIIEDSYFADLLATPTPTLLDGYMSLSTVCGSLILSCSDPEASSLPGTCYIVPNTDFKSYLGCCFTPSCSIQTFYLTHGFARSNLGPGCNQDYIYYSPVSNWPFSAFIVGKTVETTQAQWSVFPTTVCSDSCTVFLKVNTNYGVPPYTITHPWATGPSQYGSSSDGCTSTGSDTIALTIPGCPTTCSTTPTLNIPAPIIVDVCGDSVTGLSAKSITIKPVPVATAGPVSVCSGNPFNIPVSSCVTGSSFTWTGSNGTSGTGNINDNVLNTGTSAITINYSVIPTANGCLGQPISVSAEIDTLPVINGGLNDTIEPGISTQLNATGGLTYLWTPTSGLSCADCADPLATPVITTAYYVTGTNESGCSGGDTVEISVTQGSEVLYIPNSFSPNDNKLNDLFYAYGTSIKIFDLQIYDRWGELIFRTNDIKQGWDGKYKGKMVEGGVYVYAVSCEWLSGVEAYRNGIVTVWR
ncbi:MAG: gliding motility-associated C-terminal domain-containing protein [Bacteroidia bacterium]|nr:gliding motility-associated C-terminal domain-containing protein [Bacteroidia bacterium]